MSSIPALATILLPGTYVIRDGDAPSLAMICLVTTVTRTGCLAPYLRDLRQLRTHDSDLLTHGLTPVAAFGRQVTVDLKGGMAMAEASTGMLATASYADGAPRRWSDADNLRLIAITPAVLAWLRKRQGDTA
jgi:hypothetical protein